MVGKRSAEFMVAVQAEKKKGENSSEEKTGRGQKGECKRIKNRDHHRQVKGKERALGVHPDKKGRESDEEK